MQIKRYILCEVCTGTDRVNEYLCGFDMSDSIVGNIYKIRDDEVTKIMMEYIEMNDNMCTIMTEEGYSQGHKIVHEKGCNMDAIVYIGASFGGHIERSRYAYENGCEMDMYVYQHEEAV